MVIAFVVAGVVTDVAVVAPAMVATVVLDVVGSCYGCYVPCFG